MVVRGPDMSTGLVFKASQWLNNVQFWVLPGSCIVCHKPSGRQFDLCSPCQQTLTRIDRPCLGCALPLPPGDYCSPFCGRCLGHKRRMARTVAGFAYTDPTAALITRFKYHAALHHGRVLGDLLAECLRQDYRGLPLPDLLVPVPLHPTRLRERGFNQALVLARQLGKALRIPVAPEALERVRQTPPQQGLSARERKHNLRGAFRVRGEGEVLRATSIALIDDVVTTMSTMHELARVVRRAHKGKPELHVWCLARA